MIHPTIHLNGTAKQDLLDQWYEAYTDLAVARDTLTKAWPNGRDYYPQGPDAIRIAENEHSERLQAIRKIMCDLDDLISRASG